MSTVIVPDIGDIVDPETIQEIKDDLDAIESDLSSILGNGSVVARGDRQTNSTAASAEQSVLRLDNVPLVNGRVYWIGTNPLVTDVTVNNDAPRVFIRINTAGTATTASTNIALNQSRTADQTIGELLSVGLMYTPGATVTASILLSHSRASGTGNVQILGSSTIPIQMWVVDLGDDPGDTGVDL